jgi:DNA-binding Lrp family transcriptional regulator
VATRSIEEYNEFIQRRLSQIEGVHAIESRMVLEETKHTTELPLQLLGLRAPQKSAE